MAWYTKRKMPVISQDLTIEASDNSATADSISKQDLEPPKANQESIKERWPGGV